MFRRSLRGIVFSGSRKSQNQSLHRKGISKKNGKIDSAARFSKKNKKKVEIFDRILLNMRGSDIDQSLKMSILLDLAHIGGTNFNLPNGTYKLMEDKYKVKLDTILSLVLTRKK